MRTRALWVRTRSASTDATVPPSDAKARAGSRRASRTAEVTRVILPWILSGLVGSQRCHVRDNFPRFVFGQTRLERRHVGILAPVPDLVEDDPFGVAGER